MADEQSGGGSRIPSAFGDFGAAIGDIGSYFGAEAKTASDIAEAQQYDLAAQLAFQNEQYTKTSTAIQEAQSDRELYLSMGRTQSSVAAAGFTTGGSALDILRSSAAQGSLQKAALGEQGLISEASYQEQGQSYQIMAGAAREAASAEKTAGIFDLVSGGLSAITGGVLLGTPASKV